MIKGATSYRLFLVALWATLVVGALITQPQLSLKQTLLVLFSLAVAFLCQRWLFGTRYFGESAKVVAGTTREEE
ncbi:MAG: hypothetical protein HY074_02190, partial [Deltaproteobacteria bacterium]|nr:hypothetical protein [Deltaproteobacteria bacterium]